MQLVEFPHGDGVDVILGGGRAQFLPNSESDREYEDQDGVRDDDRDLISEWLAKSNQRHYAWDNESLRHYSNRPDSQVLGLFEPSHMQFEADRNKASNGEPSLAEMTRIAIERLQQNSRGFFLLVEAGRIDHAHHFSNAYRALWDTVALSQAVEVAQQMLSADNSLLIVTADHSHTLTISGYPRRGNPILGKVEGLPGLPMKDQRGKPYTTLSYANGPGYVQELPDLETIDTTHPDYQQVGTVPLPAETHAGEDVPAYASGVNADAAHGVMEQNKLFDVMRDALLGSN